MIHILLKVKDMCILYMYMYLINVSYLYSFFYFNLNYSTLLLNYNIFYWKQMSRVFFFN